MASQQVLWVPVTTLVGARTNTTLIQVGHGRRRRHKRPHDVRLAVGRLTVGCQLGAGECRSTLEAASSTPARRTANYPPTLWHDSFIQTLTTNDSMEVVAAARIEELKGVVRGWISGGDGAAGGAAAKLELLDAVRRLGVSYHFEAEATAELRALAAKLEEVLLELDGDLLHTALLFRLLREHGLPVPQDAFNRFKDESKEGGTGFKRSLKKDVEGMLSLYEASFLACPGDQMALDEARAFAKEGLQQEFLQLTAAGLTDGDGIVVSHAAELIMARERVEYAMEMPLHWSMPRLYARWFIDVYGRDDKASPVLLELAKLDFNVVQYAHKRDVKDASRWWKDSGLQNLHFARDRLMECFFWTIGVIFEPQFWLCRRGLTRVNALITTIDDVYDAYGTIDELESFTEAVERWDVDALEELPDYMKVCIQVLWQTTKEIAEQCHQRNGFNCLSYLKKSWIGLCNAYLIEARWNQSKHMPTLEEYLGNAWVSISGPVILTHAYFMLSDNIGRKELDSLRNYGDLIRWSSTILRLSDDLGTSTAEVERGDIPKSVQCYMNETNVSESVARENVRLLISETWIRMNEEILLKNFSTPFVKAAANLARMAQFIYQNGDGHGEPENETKNFINLLLIESIY